MKLNVTSSSWWLLTLCVLSLNLMCAVAEEEQPLENEGDIPVVEGKGGDIILPEEDDVLVLNSDNFDYIIASRDPILIEFYAPWCGHCKSLAPHYSAAAKALKAEGITIAKLDATEEEAIASRYQVTGYPTIKLFRKGEPAEDFDGDRTTEGIIEYMKQKSDPNYKPPPSSVIDLTDDTFHPVVDSAALILVEFYAPWCGHCKKLAPEYEKAAKALLSESVPLAKVDATENKDVTQEYGVTGYPTLKVFRNGRVFDYKGGRDERSIVSYMLDQKSLPSKLIQSSSDVKKNILKTKSTVFGYFSSNSGPLYEEFIAAANNMRGDMTFVHTDVPEIAELYKVPKDSIAVIMPQIYYNKFEEDLKIMKQSQGVSADSITSWVTKHSVPLLGQRTSSNADILYSQRPLLVVYGEIDFSHAHIKATQHLRSKLLSLADKYRDKITFALSNEEDFEEEIKSVGLGESGENVNAAIFTEKQKFSMEPDDDYEEEIEEFIEKFFAGKLRPYLKSQAVPKKQSGPVKVLVAKNFEQEVLKGDRDYLVEFYAPWCGHCKKLEPVLKQLAKQISTEKTDVVVAKFDATANDIPVNFDVSGFPTLFYVKKNDVLNPVKYEEGDRTLEGLKKFISSQQSSGKEEL